MLRPLGHADAKIQIVGGDLLRVQSAPTDPDERGRRSATRWPTQAGVAAGRAWRSPRSARRGASEISNKAIRALVVFFVAIALYITFALRDWRMAVGALVAVVHDIVISVGVYSLFSSRSRRPR